MLPEGAEPWKHVTDPAAACILSLLRIQWKPAAADGWRKWVNLSGDEIDIVLQLSGRLLPDNSNKITYGKLLLLDGAPLVTDNISRIEQFRSS